MDIRRTPIRICGYEILQPENPDKTPHSGCFAEIMRYHRIYISFADPFSFIEQCPQNRTQAGCFSTEHFRHSPVIDYDFHIHPMNTAPVIHLFQKLSHRQKHKFPDIRKYQCDLRSLRIHFIHNRKSCSSVGNRLWQN